MSESQSNNSNQDAPHPSSDHELLVAYLDGELSAEDSAKLELRLADEETLRGELHELQQTWDMLDQLPSTDLDHSFTRSTIEMVIQEVKADKKKSAPRWKWPLKAAGAIGLVLGSAAISYSAVRYFQERPTRELIQDLEFYENADIYRQVPSIELLERLHDQGVLPADLNNEEFADEY